MFAHHTPHLVVVGTYKCGVLFRVSLALEDDDGHTGIVGTVDGRRDGLHLVGSHDEQVDARGHQTVNLLHLPLVAVVGRSKAQVDIAVQIGTHTQFGILLLAPDVLGALRHTNDILIFLLANTTQATGNEHKAQKHLLDSR